jgi:hypothetical protein
MNRPARVRSIDALDHLAAAIHAFAAEASVALDDLRMDLHRAIQWIQYDQKEYWTQELRRAEQAVTEAKLSLERRRMFRIGDQQPSCREQEKALEAAKRRVVAARQKLEAVKRWARLLEHQSMECRSALAPLAQWIQADVPRAITLLKRMSGALESYVGLALPADAPRPEEGVVPSAEGADQSSGASGPSPQLEAQPASDSSQETPEVVEEP